MADDRTLRGGRDRKRIDISEDYELRDWSQKFDVSPDDLKKAVEEVGNNADMVEQYLKEQKGR